TKIQDIADLLCGRIQFQANFLLDPGQRFYTSLVTQCGDNTFGFCLWLRREYHTVENQAEGTEPAFSQGLSRLLSKLPLAVRAAIKRYFIVRCGKLYQLHPIAAQTTHF